VNRGNRHNTFIARFGYFSSIRAAADFDS